MNSFIDLRIHICLHRCIHNHSLTDMDFY